MGISKTHTAKALSSHPPRHPKPTSSSSSTHTPVTTTASTAPLAPPPPAAAAAAAVVQTHKQHAKWPALFKKHIGVLEAHAKMLERVRQSLGGKEEAVEKGREEEWVQICGMVERARGTVGMAREAGRVFLEERYQRGMKNLQDKEKERKAARKEAGGKKKNVNMEPLGTNEKVGNTKADSGSETDGESSADEEGDAAAATFAPLSIGMKGRGASGASREDDSAEKEEEVPTANQNKAVPNSLEPNPYFVIDTEPTPVVLNGDEPVAEKKRKKSKAKEADAEGERRKKPTSAIPDTENVDFIAVEAQLKAEVDAALKAKEERDKAAELTESKGEKKKRKRRESGEDAEVAVKKSKKDKKKRKAEDIGDGEDSSSSKKKQKKRKADE